MCNRVLAGALKSMQDSSRGAKRDVRLQMQKMEEDIMAMQIALADEKIAKMQRGPKLQSWRRWSAGKRSKACTNLSQLRSVLDLEPPHAVLQGRPAPLSLNARPCSSLRRECVLLLETIEAWLQERSNTLPPNKHCNMNDWLMQCCSHSGAASSASHGEGIER